MKKNVCGWHHWLNGHEFEQASGDGEGPKSLVCCSPWYYRESDTTERLNNSNKNQEEKIEYNPIWLAFTCLPVQAQSVFKFFLMQEEAQERHNFLRTPEIVMQPWPNQRETKPAAARNAQFLFLPSMGSYQLLKKHANPKSPGASPE